MLEAAICSGVEITDGPSGEVVNKTCTLTFSGGGIADLVGLRGNATLTWSDSRLLERVRCPDFFAVVFFFAICG